MDPEKQLDIIVNGKVQFAVQHYLHGDWSKLPLLFTIPRSLFDAWADGTALPYGRVFRQKSSHDGVYVLRDEEGWLVFQQEKGIPMPGRIYASYRQAKRAALGLEFLSVLRGAV
jgi:hypothetical protein